MNKEIKYRAINPDTNKLEDVFSLELNSKRLSFDGVTYYTFEETKPQQFIGLLDKNGKEIYEGDIIEEKYLNDIIIHEVVFYKGCFNFNAQNGNYSFEVIGNIFENSELLN